MDVVFGKYWLSQCFDAKGESAPVGLSGCRFRERRESGKCPGQSLDGAVFPDLRWCFRVLEALVGLHQKQKQKPESRQCLLIFRKVLQERSLLKESHQRALSCGNEVMMLMVSIQR